MLQITMEAANLMKDRLADQEASSQDAFRFIDIGGGRVGLDIGPRREDDLEFNDGDQPLLYVPSDLALGLTTRTLDVATQEDPRDLLIRPAAAPDSEQRAPYMAPGSDTVGLILRPSTGTEEAGTFSSQSIHSAKRIDPENDR